jgi:hypothetical protein
LKERGEVRKGMKEEQNKPHAVEYFVIRQQLLS